MFDQSGFRLRCDWGPDGLAALGPGSDAIAIVDVLRFTTCVDVAVSQGAVVLPYPWADQSARAFAERHDAELAGWREDPATPWSLSPADLAGIPAGTRLVLPSPNGSALAVAANRHGAIVFAGCLRNAPAVASAALEAGGAVAVIAAGERWHRGDGPVRPCVEDLLGAGAVIAAAIEQGVDRDEASPEALGAAAAYREAQDDLGSWLTQTASGRELAARGWSDDIAMAAAADVSSAVPRLVAWPPDGTRSSAEPAPPALPDAAFVDARARSTGNDERLG